MSGMGVGNGLGGGGGVAINPVGPLSRCDEFSTVRTSAAINGSLVEPWGDSTRTGVDTETCMNIIPNVGPSIINHTGVTFGGSNNRCSYADAYAWMDFPTGFNAAAHAGLGRIVVMYDSSGRAAWGFLGAGGSGETLGSELSTSWSNVNFITFSSSGNSITEAIANTMYQQAISNSFTLIKGNAVNINISWITNSGSGDIRLRTASPGGYDTGTYDIVLPYSLSSQDTSIFMSWGNNYLTALFVSLSSSINFSVSSFSVKKILTPATTGCWVYPTLAKAIAGNTAQSGWNKPSAFNMNSTTYTFNIYEPRIGGKLFVMGGKATPAYGDPGYWRTTAITRAAGQIGAAKITLGDVTSGFEFGFSNAKTGALVGNSFRVVSDTVKPYDGSTAGPTVSIPTDSTEVTKAVVLRAAGAHFFRKIGSGYWKYLYSTLTNNTASLYLGIAGYSQAFTADWIRPPFLKWLPTPLLSDSFAAADATSNHGRLSDGLGHAETTGLGSGGSGVAWSGGSGAIVSNRLVITPTLGAELNSGDIVVGNWYQITATQANFFYTGCAVGYTFKCATAKTLSADNKVKLITLSTARNIVTLTTKDIEIKAAFTMATGLQEGVVFGLNEAGTSFIIAYHNGAGSIIMDICIEGTYTNKESITTAYGADKELRVRRDGREIWVYYGDVLQDAANGPSTTLSEAEDAALSGLKCGLFSTSELNSFNYATVMATGTAGEYNFLNVLVGS